MGIGGWVNNSSDGVHILITATEDVANIFYKKVIATAPALSIVQQHSMVQIALQQFTDFKIQASKNTATASLLITPDFAMCSRCKAELQDKNNRRYHYPFITCTQCGPRYSIIQKLPFDRLNTSMRPFVQCNDCSEEYHNPTDRRYFSQTNSCKDCGVQMKLYNKQQDALSDDAKKIIEQIIFEINNGKIIAVKGIGGYLLLCDAGNEKTIRLLRRRKHRPVKPFALMVPSIEEITDVFDLNEQAKNLLQSPAAPILLLQLKKNTVTSVCRNDIAPGLSKLGVMLPYTPLFHLIATGFGRAMIATSANISDGSIVYDDTVAVAELTVLADYIVTHNREIVLPQDDSLVQFSPLTNTKIILRRSRGLAPSYIGYQVSSDKIIFSTGALLKSSCCFVNNGNVFISQYLGNTDGYEAQLAYEKTASHFFTLVNTKPTIIIADKHPGYFAHQYAKQLSNDLQIPFVMVQHHKAHFASVLAENNLLKSKEPVLGIIWDGIGLGDDGNIWGGEFFVYENNAMERRYHFDYFPIIAGDKMAMEPRLAALCICTGVWMADDILQQKFTAAEWQLYNKMALVDTAIQCSSVGRIFDAVASLLNLCDKQTYEGEAAMLLETVAQKYVDANGYGFASSYFMDGAHYHKIPTATLFAGIIADIKKGKATDFIAAKFHYSLVHLVKIIAGHLQINSLAFSGGVFQNSLLVDLLQHHLSTTHPLYFHQQLSPNDENIAFGQMVYYDINIDKSTEVKKEDEAKIKLASFIEN